MDKTKSKVAKLSSCSAPADLDNQRKSPMAEMISNRKPSNSSFNIDNLLQTASINRKSPVTDTGSSYKAENAGNLSCNWSTISPNTSTITQPMGFIVQQSQTESASDPDESHVSKEPSLHSPPAETTNKQISENNNTENNDIISVE